jgi:hypothetical protein
MRINVVYSTQHWIMPKILIGILIALGAVIFILEGRARVKKGGSFMPKMGKIFAENYDKMKFWGSIVLMAAYYFLLDKIGFTVCSIIFLILFNTLFAGKDRMKDKKYHINSVIISVVACVLVSIVFGTVFAITLPSGFCTIEIPAWNFIMY